MTCSGTRRTSVLAVVVTAPVVKVARKKPNADVKSAVAAAQAAHLGNLAYRENRVVRAADSLA